MTYLDELTKFGQKHLQNIKNIKLVAFDVDGVLTDGTLHYQSNGESTKIFNVKDGVGLKLLMDSGYKVVVITAKDSAMVKRRVEDLGIQHYFPGAKDKRLVLESCANSFQLTMSQCAFIGDDMVDLNAMGECGYAVCPNDAYSLVKEKVDAIVPVNGGQGVARYVADVILVANDQYEAAYNLAKMPDFERKR